MAFHTMYRNVKYIRTTIQRTPITDGILRPSNREMYMEKHPDITNPRDNSPLVPCYIGVSL